MSKKTKFAFGVCLSLLGLIAVVIAVTIVDGGNDLLEDLGYVSFAAGLVFITLGSNLSKMKKG